MIVNAPPNLDIFARIFHYRCLLTGVLQHVALQANDRRAKYAANRAHFGRTETVFALHVLAVQKAIDCVCECE